jgi:hypothetical protein
MILIFIRIDRVDVDNRSLVHSVHRRYMSQPAMHDAQSEDSAYRQTADCFISVSIGSLLLMHSLEIVVVMWPTR